MNNNRVVVISGAGAGIGKLAAEHFLNNGDSVVGVDIVDNKSISETLLANKSFSYQKTDITSTQDVSKLYDFINGEFGRVDVVCNIAGGFGANCTIEETSEDDWYKLMDLNLKSIFLMTKYAVPLMKKNNSGRIINIASIAGRQPQGKSCITYAASKAGVIGFTKYMAMELGPFGITVNAVSPSTTLTDRVRAIRSDEDVNRLKAKIPLGRLAVPEDTVNAIFFLASNEAAFITGMTLDVTGGLYMN